MKESMLAVLALTLIAAISVSNVAAISSPETNEAVLGIMQAGNLTNETSAANETNAEQLALKNWNSFIENFEYQNEILNGTIRGNSTYREALDSITSVLVLNSKALTEAERVNPDSKYLDFHSYTINAMEYLNVYLYNMAKYFETRDARYARTAGSAFNTTVEYYNLGKDEADFLF